MAVFDDIYGPLGHDAASRIGRLGAKSYLRPGSEAATLATASGAVTSTHVKRVVVILAVTTMMTGCGRSQVKRTADGLPFHSDPHHAGDGSPTPEAADTASTK